MNNWMKRIISVGAVLLSAFIICDVAYAAGINGYNYSDAASGGGWISTASGIKYNSYGKINYSDGINSVVIDTADIAAIDNMVGTGKRKIQEAIKNIDQDDRLETSVWDDSYFPSFYELADLTSSSQTVSDEQKQKQAVNYKNETVFYRDTTASEAGNLGRTTTDDTGLIVNCKEANADNLSAGAVAFVDGNIIWGNGADNEEFYKLGYIDGINENNKYTIIYNYHHHVDENGETTTDTTRSVSGGCYNKGSHTHTSSCSYTTKPTTHKTTYNQHVGYPCCWNCPTCGTNINADENGNIYHECTYTTKDKSYTCGDLPLNVWKLSCGKTEGQIESATVIFESSTEQETEIVSSSEESIIIEEESEVYE